MLPGLGGGSAEAGSSGEILVTDRSLIQPYFVGHWVEVREPVESQLKGIWQITEIGIDAASGKELLTLDDDANVAPGDLWQGLYRFDSVYVQGAAKLAFGDADDIPDDAFDVEDGSTVIRHNYGGPLIAGSMGVAAHDHSYWVTGEGVTITDPDGIQNVRLASSAAGQGPWPVTVGADGSFVRAVTGAVGDVIRLEATDAHPLTPMTSTVEIGALPANSGPPIVEASRVRFAHGDTGYSVVGDAGAVADSEFPVLVQLHNVTTGHVDSFSPATDGSFSRPAAGTYGDAFLLEATDGHPEALTTTLDLGSMPDLVPPSVDAGKVSIRAYSRSFWVTGSAGAVSDDNPGVQSSLVDPAHPDWGPVVLTLAANGSFPATAVDAPTGTVLLLRAQDAVGRVTEAPLPALPPNDGPPTIGQFSATIKSGRYHVGGGCPIGKEEDYCFVSSTDGLEAVRLENRTTPVFGPWPVPLSVWGFDLEVQGAVGDRIYFVAEDGHPDWQTASRQIWTLPHISGAPNLTAGQLVLRNDVGTYRLVVVAGAITGSPGPLALDAQVYHNDGEAWTQVGGGSASITSGEGADVILSGGAVGDLVLLSAATSSGLPTMVRAGFLPEPVSGPEIEAGLFSLKLDSCSPILVAPAGAVTAEVLPVRVTVTVSHPELSGSWTSDPVELEPAQDIRIDLQNVEPGSSTRGHRGGRRPDLATDRERPGSHRAGDRSGGGRVREGAVLLRFQALPRAAARGGHHRPSLDGHPVPAQFEPGAARRRYRQRPL